MRNGMEISIQFLNVKSWVNSISLWITVFCLLPKLFMRRRGWKCRYAPHTPNRHEMFEKLSDNNNHYRQNTVRYSRLSCKNTLQSLDWIEVLIFTRIHHIDWFACFPTNISTQSTFIPYNARATTSVRPASRYFYTSQRLSNPTITQSNFAVVASSAPAPSLHRRWLSASASIHHSSSPSSR